MTDPTTTNLVLAVPTRGSDVGTWDLPINGDMSILDACAGNVTTKTLSSTNVTLSTTESQVSILRFTGALTNNIVITLGAIIKSWIVENLTTGNQFITVQGSTGTGQAISLPPGSCQIYWDGTNVKFVNLPIPIGGYWDYAGTSVPFWVNQCTVPPFLICDGSGFSAGVYPQLNQILGGTTVPDARGRARFAFNSGTGRVTAAGGGIDGNTISSGGGVQNTPIGQINLPSYTLPNSLSISGSVSLSSAANGVLNNQGVGGSANVTGGGGAYNIGSITASHSFGVAGSVTSGGSGNNLIIMPPAYIGGITMIRAG